VTIYMTTIKPSTPNAITPEALFVTLALFQLLATQRFHLFLLERKRGNLHHRNTNNPRGSTALVPTSVDLNHVIVVRVIRVNDTHDRG
jgi:hypothetical protein